MLELYEHICVNVQAITTQDYSKLYDTILKCIAIVMKFNGYWTIFEV